LFLEEFAQVVVEHDESPATLLVPDTIQALLSARIDRLGESDKHLLQTWIGCSDATLPWPSHDD
jgi:hypothetical protein